MRLGILDGVGVPEADDVGGGVSEGDEVDGGETEEEMEEDGVMLGVLDCEDAMRAALICSTVVFPSARVGGEVHSPLEASHSSARLRTPAVKPLMWLMYVTLP